MGAGFQLRRSGGCSSWVVEVVCDAIIARKIQKNVQNQSTTDEIDENHNEQMNDSND